MKNLRIELSQAVTVLLAVLLLGVSIYAGVLYRQKNQAEDQQKDNPVVFNQPNVPTEKFVTPDGVKHSTFKARETTRRDMKQRNGISPGYADSLAKALRISITDIQEIALIKANLEGQLKASYILIDSLKRRTWYFQQKYMTAQFSESDTVLKYSYTPEFGYARIEKRSGFLGLGPKKNQIDIFSKDTNMVISSVNQLSIKDNVRRKPFGIGLQAGYFWDPATGKVVKGIGLGLSYSLFRF